MGRSRNAASHGRQCQNHGITKATVEREVKKKTVVDGIRETSVRMARKYKAVIQKMEKQHEDAMNGLSKKNEELNQKLEIATEKILELTKIQNKLTTENCQLKTKISGLESDTISLVKAATLFTKAAKSIEAIITARCSTVPATVPLLVQTKHPWKPIRRTVDYLLSPM